MVTKKDSVSSSEITIDSLQVEDPEIYRPKQLPLVIKPAEGQSWANPEQEAYAKILNAAAYSNPLWSTNQTTFDGVEIPNSSIKAVEIARLVEIGKNPSAYYKYTGEIRVNTDPNSPNPRFTVTPKNVLES